MLTQSAAATLPTNLPGFHDPGLLTLLDAADAQAFDAMPFGAVRMDHDGLVLAYNAVESQLAGLPPSLVLGRRFFTAVAPCTNNRLVAGQLAAQPNVDVTLDYVLALKMKPIHVRLRLLRGEDSPHMYFLVERR